METTSPGIPAPSRRAGWQRLRNALRHPDTLGLAALAAVWAFAMREELFFGKLIWVEDIVTQAYGLRAYNANMLRAGRFPLWTPDLWGGFPVFADSFVEPLYPLNLLLLPVQSHMAAMAALYTLSLLIAGLGAYLLMRSLRLGALAAFCGGVTYMLSGFMVTKTMHLNIIGCAIWLPLMCWALERALQSGSWRYVAVGALFTGVEMFGGHVQTAVMGLMGLALYALLRLAAPPPELTARCGAGLRGLARRALQVALLAGAIGALGSALSAVQMIPFAELFTTSARNNASWSITIASIGSMAPFQLISTLFPYFFRLPPSGSIWDPFGWGFAYQNETYAYLGAPAVWLAVAALALPHGRRRLALGALAGALVFLLVAMGDKTPLFRLLYNVPILHNTRMPGRYVYLVALCMALLAALGMQALEEMGRRGRGNPARTMAWGAAIGGPLLAVLALAASWLVRAYPEQAVGFVDGIARLSGTWQQVPPVDYEKLAGATSPGNVHFFFPLLLWLLSAGGLLYWYRAANPRRAALALAALLAAAALYGADFFARTPIAVAQAQVDAANSAAGGRLAPGSLDRVYSGGNGGYAPLDPNVGLAANLPEATGYTLVVPARLKQYADQANAHICTTRLLNLWGVRYLWQSLPGDWRTRGALGYSESSPAFIGALPDHAQDRFALPAGTRAAQIALLSGFTGGESLQSGDPIGEIVVEDASGATGRFVVRAGFEAGAPAPEALSLPGDPERKAYAAAFDLSSGPKGEELRRVTLRVLAPGLTWYVYGLALLGPEGTAFPVRPFLSETCGRSLVYSSGGHYLLENPSAAPRAFLVNRVIAARDPNTILAAMDGPRTDLARTALTEGLDPQSVSGDGPAGDARVIAYADRDVTVDVDARSPALLVLTDWDYPGWKATVDGRPAEIYTTDYIFRGVPVPAGAHRVRFTYDPLSLRLGAAVSLAALLLALLLLWRPRPNAVLLGAWLAAAALVAAPVVDWAELSRAWQASAALARQVPQRLQAQLPDAAPGTRFYLIELPSRPGPAWALAQPWLSRPLFDAAFPGRGTSGATIQELSDARGGVRPPWESTPGMIALRYSDGTFALTPYYFGQHSGYRLSDLLPVRPATQAPQAVFGDWLELHGSAIITQALNIDDETLGGRFLQTSWQLRKRAPAPYTLFVHFVAPDGSVVAQADHTLSVWSSDRPDGRYLDEWPAGVVIRDYVALPDGVPGSGQALEIRAGIWLPATGEHLALSSASLAVDEAGRLVLGKLAP